MSKEKIKKQKEVVYPVFQECCKYFKDDFSEIIKIFQDANMENGVVLLSEGRNTKQIDSVGPSESGGGGAPSEYKKEGGMAIEDTTDNALYEEESKGGGRRKRKSKKRKNRKRKYTRKV